METIRTNIALFKSIFESMLKSKEIDLLEQDYTKRGEAFFHVSGRGHENVAFLEPFLLPQDYLHCHYRDKALMLARGISPKQFFLSLFCKDQSHSRGRQMSAHLSDPSKNILSLVGPVGNNALQAVGVAQAIKGQNAHPIVLCALGDGTTQQGEVLESIAYAACRQLPVLYLIEDNTWAISTPTFGRTFYSRPDGEAKEFYGIEIVRVDGRNPLIVFETFDRVVTKMRNDRKPAIIVLQVERLDSHTNADDQKAYRDLNEIESSNKESDPVVILEALLKEHGLDSGELDALKVRVKEEVLQVAIEAQDSQDPKPILVAKAEIQLPEREYTGVLDGQQLTMLEAIRDVLKARMAENDQVCLFGEDIEDPKGDVFGLTRGLTRAYPERVNNSPLSESTIVGVAIGQALAGQRPVAFLQFADFFPLAFNQIFAELGSMHWRTDGGWRCPVILMVSCGGLKPGLGPFHASSMESLAAHTPGLDVFLPSTAGDAAGLLNAAFQSHRPTIFFYPKSRLNDRNQTTSHDVANQIAMIGKGRYHRRGHRLTFVCWGNMVSICDQAASQLEAVGAPCDVIDLRSISPWDEEMVLESVRQTGHLLIAQEDNITSSMASEISATVAEKISSVTIRRVCRADTYVPCHFGNQLEVLPSYKRVLTVAVQMLAGHISWQLLKLEEDGVSFVEAQGSSPSDESVTVLEWKVKVGDTLKPGMILAEMEADKAVFELACPIEGKLVEIFVPFGQMVKVGTPLIKVEKTGSRESKKPITQENPGKPLISLPDKQVRSFSSSESSGMVGISSIQIALGSRIVSNQEIADKCPTWTAQDIFKRVGIESRHWVSEEENALTLAIDAAKKALACEGLIVADLTAIFCSTGTPVNQTPSMACLTLAALSEGLNPAPELQASDINSACSGFLYCLEAAWDHLYHNPSGRVMVLTTEALSRRTNPHDYQTAPIFGDAATATLLVGAEYQKNIMARVNRPLLSGKGEKGEILRVPLEKNDFIYQDGSKVYLEATRCMLNQLEKTCFASGVSVHDLNWVVAHQANQRILNAVRQKTQLPVEKVYSNIKNYGNTSSSSIPLCLYELLPKSEPGKLLGLCAFGGGFTFGGAILRTGQ